MYPDRLLIEKNLSQIVSKGELRAAATRALDALDRFSSLFDSNRNRPVYLFSSPGRTELSGNHTDHNHGLVLAAPIDLDILAVVSPRDDRGIRLYSEGMGMIETEASRTDPDPSLFGTSVSLINGICSLFLDAGVSISGFDAYMTSLVAPGSGLSSSAAFELMIATVLNTLYANESFSPVALAKMGKKAENLFFGKPCGLLDQLACAYGGAVFMDFRHPEDPQIVPLTLDLEKEGYALCITHTGGTHANLTGAYASIPQEMKAVAAALGKEHLGEVDPAAFEEALPLLYGKLSHRAILRAFHFFSENERVLRQKDALLRGDFKSFLKDVCLSGESSFCYLQNVYNVSDPSEQPLSVGLALSRHLLEKAGEPAAWRVHGGGFAGTIQAFVPLSYLDEYRFGMERVFGQGSCKKLTIRPFGAICLSGPEEKQT